MKGVDAVIILTSATPKMQMPPPVPPERPVFYYPEGGLPQLCAASKHPPAPTPAPRQPCARAGGAG